MGPLKNETANAAVTPTRPAIHSGPKSVSAKGKIRAPSDATGSSIMHLRMNAGSRLRNEEAKYGIMRGRSVTAEHVSMSAILFKSSLLVRIDECAEQRREYKRDKERDTCPQSYDEYQKGVRES